ncbi:MAG TPA: hypothetical protein VJR89_41600 [Polyangiales bacterium]|nr:hypothetical protein [Polyangiales bacterium]
MATVQSGKSQSEKQKSTQATQKRGRNTETDTGERDENYNLISVLYHALQGAETVAQYVADAEGKSDEQLAQFFEEARGSYVELAQQAKQLLASRLDETEEEDEEDDD